MTVPGDVDEPENYPKSLRFVPNAGVDIDAYKDGDGAVCTD